MGIIFLLLILWQYIRGIIKVKQMKRFNTPTLVVISIVFIVLYIYGYSIFNSLFLIKDSIYFNQEHKFMLLVEIK